MLRDFLRTPFSGLHHRFTQSIPGETELVSIGGSRLHEALAVFSKFFADPGRIFLGFGMGSEIDTPFASGHFIHIGLVEIFFRTGAIGLIVFLWICVYFLKYAIRRVRVNIHFLLPIMVGTMNLITMFLLSSNPLLSPLYIVPIFAGMLKISTRSA